MNRRPGILWAVVAGAALTACAPIGVVPTGEAHPVSTPAAGPGAASSAAPPPPSLSFEIERCDEAPPVDFAVMCELFRDVVDLYVDPVEPEALAAAASLGMAAVDTDPAAEIPAPGFRCVVPDEAFDALCDQMVQRFTTSPATIAALMEGAVHGMFRYALDPFSTYLAGSALDAPVDTSGVVLELGMSVGARDPSGAACSPIGGECRLLVLSVFDFGAAAEQGVAPDDVIVMIDGRPVEGLSGSEATVTLFGDPGTGILLTIDRDGNQSDRSLVRRDVRLEPAEFEMMGDVAYLRLNDFSQVAAQALGAVLQTEEVSNALGILLDMRDNPGGLVLAAQAVASQFLDGGEVLVERGRSFEESLDVLPGGLAVDGPQMVVLVNRGTASSAEIVAAVLQERGRALVVGEPTFGKNLVQLVEPTRDGGQVALTIARWSTPGGLDIGLRGLQPDIVVEWDPADGGDPILDAGLAMMGG